MSKKRLFLIDAYALIFRAYYAFIKNPIVNSKGFETSAILGFFNSIFDLKRRENPDYLSVVFDKGGSADRSAIYSEYKSNRNATPEVILDSVPYIYNILNGLGITTLDLEGYEADDIIGTVAKRAEKKDFEVGEDVSEEVKLINLGRRVVLSLRQNLVARIHEHDNSIVYKQFVDLVGEIYSAEVHHIRHNVVILIDDDGNEIIMPKDRQISSDFYRKGDTIRGVIELVELKGTKPVIIMSRTSPKFLEKLFEQDIPEVFDGLITIKKVVRVPGEKAKVAVDSYDDRIDPVGACVGMKGSRIHGIVRELGNENIDVVNFTNNTQLYITRALSPAKITSLKIDDENKTVQVILDADQVSKAIGRGGYNIKLAGQLTGYEIDVFREGSEEDVELTEFSDEIDSWIIDEFKKVGLDTAKSILEHDVEDLAKRTDLEEETIAYVRKILSEEFEDN